MKVSCREGSSTTVRDCYWVIVTPEGSNIKASINQLLFLLLLLRSLELRLEQNTFTGVKVPFYFPITTIITSSDQRQAAHFLTDCDLQALLALIITYDLEDQSRKPLQTPKLIFLDPVAAFPDDFIDICSKGFVLLKLPSPPEATGNLLTIIT